MKLFRRKPPKIETENDYFQSSQLLDLSHITVPGYPIYSAYYGEVIHSLSSGTYDLSYLSMPSSGTVYDYNELSDPKFNIALTNRKARDVNFDILDCSYCGNKVLLNEGFTKEALVSLSCPSCGAGLK